MDRMTEANGDPRMQDNSRFVTALPHWATSLWEVRLHNLDPSKLKFQLTHFFDHSSTIAPTQGRSCTTKGRSSFLPSEAGTNRHTFSPTFDYLLLTFDNNTDLTTTLRRHTVPNDTNLDRTVHRRHSCNDYTTRYRPKRHRS